VLYNIGVVQCIARSVGQPKQTWAQLTRCFSAVTELLVLSLVISIPMQMIAWEDSSQKWPVITTYSALIHSSLTRAMEYSQVNLWLGESHCVEILTVVSLNTYLDPVGLIITNTQRHVPSAVLSSAAQCTRI